MPLTCNIDSKGKLARLLYGLVLVITALVLLFTWAWPVGSVLSWTVTLSLLLAGAFGLFEARAGWCVVRAMGYKTPI